MCAFLLATVVLGHVRVETPHGHPHVHADTVRALAKLDPGEPLTFEKIERAQKELQSTNLFQDVHVELLLPFEEAARLMYEDTQVTRADVAITLEEKRFWYAFPYGSVSPSNWSAGAVFADVNLFDRAKILFGTGSYGNQTKQAYVLYRDPVVLGSRFVGYDLSALARDDHVPIYMDRQKVADIHLQQFQGEATLRLFWHRDFSTLFLYGVDDVESGGATGLDSYVRAELRYDSRHAVEGFYQGALTRLWVEFSDDRIGSDFSYTRQMMIAGGWFNIGKVNFSARGEAGVEYDTSQGMPGVPFVKQFTLGGTDLRGYLTREFRGDTTASLQSEAVIPLFPIWQLKVRGDVFYDAGALYFRQAGFTRNDFHQGVGGGIRFYFKALAIPVVGVDVGYGIEENSIGYYFTFGLPE